MITSTLDRIEASQLLKVSTRTLDRYLRKYRVKTRKDGRRVLIKVEDLQKIVKNHIGQMVDIDPTKLDQILGTPAEDKSSNIVVKDIKVERVKETPQAKKTEDDGVYKDLYNELKNDLKEKQERLEAATYRVGQLESQLKNMVPMLDYTRKEKELKEANQTLEQRQQEYQDALSRAELRLRNEKMVKWIYLSIVGALLVAEPILFLFWAFS